jgi:hypothetical protein
VIEASGRKTAAGAERRSGADRDILPDPREAVIDHAAECGFAREFLVVERGIEVPSENPRNCSQFVIRGFYGLDVRLQLPNRFLAHGDVFANFAAIAFQVDGVNHQHLARADVIRCKSETARRGDCSGGFPFFSPPAQGLQPTRDRDLLRDIPAFAGCEVRTDIDFKCTERFSASPA